MKGILNNIREPKETDSAVLSVLCSAALLLAGAALGAFSKWLDNLALDSSVWWHRPLELLDLRNVFSGLAVWLVLCLCIAVFSRTPGKAAVNCLLFLGGMCAVYHLWTVVFSSFNPRGYMMIWYALTLLSPVFAVACWYGKGEHPVSVVIDALILAVLVKCCFSVGWVYFYPLSLLNTLLFLGGAAALYVSPRQIGIAAAAGLALAVAFGNVLPLE